MKAEQSGKKNEDKIRKGIIKELYARVVRKFTRRQLIIKSPNEYQADLADFSSLKHFNRNFCFLLIVVNCFTKKIYAEPLKTKTASETTAAMKKIIERVKFPIKMLLTDEGKELMNKDMKNLTKSHNIYHYNIYTKFSKAMIAEAKIKQIKRDLYIKMDLEKNQKWIDVYKEVINEINNKKNSLGFIPAKVTQKDVKNLRDKHYSYKQAVDNKAKLFKIGDQVRILLHEKNIFLKRAFIPQWSTELYTIHSIDNKFPVVFKLKDFKGNVLKQTFYRQQIQKTSFKDIWLVEKVIQRQKNRVKVHYFNLSSEYDEWIPKSSLFE